MEKVGFHVGGSTHEYIDVRIISRGIQDSDDYWDGNWLDAKVTISMGGFSGAFNANLRTDEFARFARQLKDLHANLDGQARFEPMEEQLLMTFAGDGLGHIVIEGEARDVAGTGNLLRFILESDMDQSHLPQLIAQLDVILEKYPVRGSDLEEGESESES